MQLVDVIEVKRHNSLTGQSRWRLLLACGHERQIAAVKGGRGVSAPKQVKCFECSKAGQAEGGGS